MALTLTHDESAAITNAPAPPVPLTPEQVIAYLNYQLEPMLRRRDVEVLPALRDMAAKHPEIAVDDTETDAVFTQNLGNARGLIRAAAGAKRTEERPFIDAGNALRSWFARFEAPIAAAIAPVERIMLALADKRDAIKRAQDAEEARKRQEEADKAAAAAAAALRKKNADAAEKLAIAEAAEAEARRAAATALAKPAANTQVRGIYGAVSSVRTTWTWETADFDQVPREFLCVDEAKIREAAKRRDPLTGRPTAVIPGIAWVENRKIGVR